MRRRGRLHRATSRERQRVARRVSHNHERHHAKRTVHPARRQAIAAGDFKALRRPLEGRDVGPEWICEAESDAARFAESATVPANDAATSDTGGALDVRPAGPIADPPGLAGGSAWPAALWAAGGVAVLCWMAVGRILAFRFRRKCSAIDEADVLARVAAMKARLRVRRRVEVLASPRIMSPFVFGGWRPALVLPATFTRDFDGPQQEAIIAHELAHLAARDAAWQAAATVACALLWWHLLAWWTRRRLRAAHEAAADEASLVVADGPRILAEALVKLGRSLIEQEPRFGLSLGGGLVRSGCFRCGRFQTGLGRRVERLLNLPQGARRRVRRARMAFAIFPLPALVALTAILFTAWAPSQAPITEGDTTMHVLTNSWRRSILATALCAMLTNSPASAAAQDKSVTPPPTAAEREKIERLLRSVDEKTEQLDNARKRQEDLERMIIEVLERSRADREKLEQLVRSRQELAAKLEKEGKHEEAQAVMRGTHEIMKTAGPESQSGMTPSDSEREKIRSRVKEMSQMINQLENSGKHEEAEQMRQRARALYSQINQYGTGTSPRPERGEISATGTSSGGDMGARLQHLRAALENLRAVGCEPEAQHVMELIQHIESEAGGQEKNVYSRLDRTDPLSGAASAARDQANSAVINELRAQIEQMRREMSEIRDELKRGKTSGNYNRSTDAPPPR
jgi:hypothetical protein